MRPPRPVPRGPPGPVARWAYRGVGGAATALALAGVALPGLPTVPFLLVALWAFSRGAPEWAERLRRHPKLGPVLVDWETRRAIPRPAKAAAAVGVTGSWAAFAASVQSLAASLALGAALAAVLAYVLTRPSK
ncbi:conserved hypothetical protein [Phenylobacterium zucineum HLK1]|uniref:DUF454 domain-containing protein n=1 Tax=Phenylobacterium zucineum (strain HLK1) TaxID=450851 RepID=B4RF46_PHEZH|nr:YbaN family protein [Phenylobacterium zucineum]ACG77034.1 conserved hypothetical protein [Phenylobacterium zucineum HLK1]